MGCLLRQYSAVLAEENTYVYGTGLSRQGQTREVPCFVMRIAIVTLQFRGLGLTNVRKKAGMGSATLGVEPAGFIEAELAVDGEAHFRGV